MTCHDFRNLPYQLENGLAKMIDELTISGAAPVGVNGMLYGYEHTPTSRSNKLPGEAALQGLFRPMLAAEVNIAAIEMEIKSLAWGNESDWYPRLVKRCEKAYDFFSNAPRGVTCLNGRLVQTPQGGVELVAHQPEQRSRSCIPVTYQGDLAAFIQEAEELMPPTLWAAFRAHMYEQLIARSATT